MSPKIAPPIDPPKPTSPATVPTADNGNTSAGMVMIIPDHDCCAKKAMLNSAIAYPTGTCVTSMTAVIINALIPKTHLREASRDFPLRSSWLEVQPPRKLPTPEAAYGIQAK